MRHARPGCVILGVCGRNDDCFVGQAVLPNATYFLPTSGIRRRWWGGPPGPRGTPPSRNRYNDINILQGASTPTGASAADPGVRPTNNTGVVTGKSMWH